MRAFFGVIFALGLIGPAQAQDAVKIDPQFPNKMFDGAVGADKNYACFVRVCALRWACAEPCCPIKPPLVTSTAS